MTDPTYYILKREQCENCVGGVVTLRNTDDGYETSFACVLCDNGYRSIEVDLLDVLSKLRWQEPGRGANVVQMRALRIEE